MKQTQREVNEFYEEKVVEQQLSLDRSPHVTHHTKTTHTHTHHAFSESHLQ